MSKISVAAVTFFDKENNIDKEANLKLYERLFVEGANSVIIGGSTGEGPTLTWKEKKMLVQLAIEAREKSFKNISGGTPRIILNVGTNNTEETVSYILELNSEQYENKPDEIMIVCPYYNKPNQEGLYKHFEVISKTSKIPIMLYHIPGRTNVSLDINTFKRIVSLKNIKSVKDSSGDISLVSKLIKYIQSKNLNVEVYSGDDHNTLPYMSLGSVGVVSVLGNLNIKSIREMIDLFEEGKQKDAALEQAKIIKTCEKLFPVFAPNPVPIKYLMSEENMGSDYVRLPLVSLSNTEKKTIKQVL